jgi:hypothetical protein
VTARYKKAILATKAAPAAQPKECVQARNASKQPAFEGVYTFIMHLKTRPETLTPCEEG